MKGCLESVLNQSYVKAHIFWDILRCVIHSVHGVHFGKFYHAAARKFPGGIKFATPVVALENVHRWHLQQARAE